MREKTGVCFKGKPIVTLKSSVSPGIELSTGSNKLSSTNTKAIPSEVPFLFMISLISVPESFACPTLPGTPNTDISFLVFLNVSLIQLSGPKVFFAMCFLKKCRLFNEVRFLFWLNIFEFTP